MVKMLACVLTVLSVRTYHASRVLNKLLQRSRNTALLREDETEKLRRSSGHLSRDTHRSASVGGDTAAVGELKVELALATRKLNAGMVDSGIGP